VGALNPVKGCGRHAAALGCDAVWGSPDIYFVKIKYNRIKCKFMKQGCDSGRINRMPLKTQNPGHIAEAGVT